MQGIKEWTIPAQNVLSLCWQGDMLVDWAGGETKFHLDGTVERAKVNYAYRFDAAVVSPTGTYAVIYEKLGTKGLVLKNGSILREINRSFYFANAYEYPVALFQLPDGREVIAHCPEKYNRIEIDELETGQRLTDTPERKPIDFFYSRLAANDTGKYLFTEGWIWHPIDAVTLYDIEAVLKDSMLLDRWDFMPPLSAEISSAAFLGDDKLILTSSSDTELIDKDDPGLMRPNALAVYDIWQKQILSQVTPETIVGTVMPLGSNKIIGFYEHPKLMDLETGKVLYQWAELNSGKQTSSIIHHIEPVPPLAFDPVNSRFAVADKEAIHIIQIDPVGLKI